MSPSSSIASAGGSPAPLPGPGMTRRHALGLFGAGVAGSALPWWVGVMPAYADCDPNTCVKGCGDSRVCGTDGGTACGNGPGPGPELRPLQDVPEVLLCRPGVRRGGILLFADREQHEQVVLLHRGAGLQHEGPGRVPLRLRITMRRQVLRLPARLVRVGPVRALCAFQRRPLRPQVLPAGNVRCASEGNGCFCLKRKYCGSACCAEARTARCCAAAAARRIPPWGSGRPTP